jgi:hypothetical protein
MVIVSDPDDAKHGEINVVESPQKAARLVETLLEAGFDQARIRVFTGAEMDMHVRHRPVVALVTGDEAEGEAEAPAPAQTQAPEPVATATKAESRKEAEARKQAEARDDAIAAAAAEPYQQNGQKFSTAFRPA